MRTLFIAICFLGAACTKPNPNRCCVDASDCAANNIPQGNICQEGLVCRGNQCVVDSCTDASQCDANAPYCVAGVCGSACTQDSECPGAAQDASDQYCVGGGCVECREQMNDCPSMTPVCESNSCRACRANTECASQLCDVGSGECVDATTILYASPAGGTTAACSLADPCSADHAMQLAMSNPARSTIKLAAGTYTSVTLTGGTVTIFGDGQTTTTIGATASGGTLRLRDLKSASITAEPTTTGAPRPTLDLDRVTCVGDDCLYGVAAVVTVRRSTISCGAACVDEPIYIPGNAAAANGATDLTIDQSLVLGGASWAFVLANGSSFQIRNSVVVGASKTFELFHFSGGNTAPSTVSFSTLFNVHLDCGSSTTPWVTADDSIFLVTAAGTSADTVSGNACAHTFDIITPQNLTPTGSNNVLGVDPGLVNPDGGDFHLLATSRAIDTANPAATSNTYDLDGTSRPQGPHNDIGAYEYH